MAALRSARSAQAPSIAAAGAQNLLDQPEFHDLRKLRSILRIVEEQKTLYDMVADAMINEAASVKIGAELGSEELADLSVVTVPYRFGPQRDRDALNPGPATHALCAPCRARVGNCRYA